MFLVAREQQRQGERPWIVCSPGSPLQARARLAGVPTYPLSSRGEWDLESVRRLRRLIALSAPDVVHAHTSHTHGLAWMAVARGPAVPLVVHRRVDFEPATHPISRLKYRSPHVQAFVAVSEFVAGVLLRAGIEPDRVFVVRSSVPEPPQIAPDRVAGLRRELLGNDGAHPLLLVVGALVDHKGHRYLLEAMPSIRARFPGVRLAIVGDGPLKTTLERQVARTNSASTVRFLGHRHDPVDWIQAADLLVVPSCQEGLNTSILDAQWSRCPVVAAAAGGIPELVSNRTGWLVPPRDPHALATAILDALTRPEERAVRTRNARKTVERISSLPNMVHALGRIYDLAARRFHNSAR